MNSGTMNPWLTSTDDSLTNKKFKQACKQNKNTYTTKQAIQTAAMLSLIKKINVPLCAFSVLSGCIHTASNK
jgi:hypothetical protein